MNSQKYRQANQRKDKMKGSQKDRQTDRQIDRQMNSKEAKNIEMKDNYIERQKDR